jgi:hypothetical protein
LRRRCGNGSGNKRWAFTIRGAGKCASNGCGLRRAAIIIAPRRAGRDRARNAHWRGNLHHNRTICLRLLHGLVR